MTMRDRPCDLPRSEPAVAPHLLHGWLAARSLARGISAPVRDRGGWRVDTNSETETCRWVFGSVDEEVRALAMTIHAPRQFIKACVPTARLARVLPGDWRLDDLSYVMVAGDRREPRSLVPGYTLSAEQFDDVAAVFIRTADGALAASGYAAEAAGAFVYDRIVVAPDHWRRGLGGAMMTTLAGFRRDADATEVLVATDAGRALYGSLGWRVAAPYASASLPE